MAWENGGRRIGRILRLISRLIRGLRVEYSSFGKVHIGFLSLGSYNNNVFGVLSSLSANI